MKFLRVGGLAVMREGDRIRFTIPTAHSSTTLSQEEARELTRFLVEPISEEPQPDNTGV